MRHFDIRHGKHVMLGAHGGVKEMEIFKAVRQEASWSWQHALYVKSYVCPVDL
jgi:hypothetical protein